MLHLAVEIGKDYILISRERRVANQRRMEHGTEASGRRSRHDQ
jgi:hypothetical protein